jgi:hypothetical protein
VTPINSQISRRLRIAGIGILLALAAYTAIGSILSNYYKGIIQAKLPGLAAKATDSLYEITVQDIRINIFTRVVSVTGLRMSANLDVIQRRYAEGRPPHVILDVTVPEAEIAGVHWKELRKETELTCRSVHFYNPEIRVQVLPGWKERIRRVRTHGPTVSRVYARKITIDDPVFDVRYSYGSDAFSIQTTGGKISANDWDFHPGKPFDTTRFFSAKSADVRLEGINYQYPGALYTYAMGSIHFQSARDLLEINGVHIKPAFSYDEIYQRIGYRRDIYDCTLPIVSLQGFKWRNLISAEHALIAERLVIDTPQLSIYLSKRPPVNPTPHPAYFPSQWLHRLALPINIRLLALWNGDVKYSELNGKTGAKGTLDFSYLRGNVTNITNMPEIIAKDSGCHIYAHGKLAHKADIATVIRFPLKSMKGAFSLAARLKGLDAGSVRTAVQAMAIADVKSFQLQDARVNMVGNEDSVWGSATLLYNRLKVKLQRWNEVDSDIHNRVLLTFLANKLLLYDANPMPGEDVRIVDIGLARGTIRSFFQVVWKGIFQAGMKTAVREEGAFDIVQRSNAAKGKPKRRFFKDLFPRRRR